MRRSIALALLASTALAAPVIAQTSAATQTANLTAVYGTNCPVNVQATRGSAGLVATSQPNATEHAKPIHDPQRALHLFFLPGTGHAVAEANLTLHGLAGAQYFPATSNSAHPTETFAIAPTAAQNHMLAAMVYAQKLTGVQWIELTDLTFADGTAWHSSANSTCRITPNNFRLVASEIR